MSWRALQTDPIDIDTGVSPDRARAVADALARRAVPIVVRREGRVEPLASGALYRLPGLRLRLLLVTCKHLFEQGVAVGDMALPLGDSGRLLSLSAARATVLEHPQQDLAAIALNDARACAQLLQHWQALPSLPRAGTQSATQTFVIAGYPYVQMRRVDAVLYCRPVVLFARSTQRDEALLCFSYAREAQRIDGMRIHAPELDGVSGATVWQLCSESESSIDCVLEPSAVQVAFKHDAYVRAEPLSALLPYLHN